jgi:hypothetical protein
MHIEIVEKYCFDIYGYSGIAADKDYAGTALNYDKMWQTVKSNNIKNKGLIWVYEENDKVFAGVELMGTPEPTIGLEQKTVTLLKYAYYKHIGPYQLIKHSGHNMREELRRKGLVTIFPYIEIYGHWTNDETKLQTELLMSLM